MQIKRFSRNKTEELEPNVRLGWFSNGKAFRQFVAAPRDQGNRGLLGWDSNSTPNSKTALETPFGDEQAANEVAKKGDNRKEFDFMARVSFTEANASAPFIL